MSEIKYRVAIVGCGFMGQHYARAYSTYPDTEIVAIAEYNPERRADPLRAGVPPVRVE